MKPFITRHPAATYFTLAFAISWAGVLLIIGGPRGMVGTTAQDDPLFPFVYLAMLAGPSIAGLLLTAVVYGKPGLRALLQRLLKWQVEARWYAAALLTAPAVITAVLLALSLLSPQFRSGVLTSNDKTSVLLFAFVVGLGAGVFEELGWTGFAVPQLRRRHGILTTGLVVGVLWGAWHLLAVLWGIGNRASTVPLALFVSLDLVSVLPAFRVLMVWVYDRTESLLLAMLMHASLTTSLLILTPRTTGLPLLSFDVMLATALWILIAAMGATNGWTLSRQPLQRRAA